MERRCQYCNRGLPVSSVFLMLLEAFADASLANAAKAHATPGVADLGETQNRTRRPNRGQRGPAWTIRSGISMGEIVPRSTARARARCGRGANRHKDKARSASTERHRCAREAGRGFRYGVDRTDTVASESLHGGGTAR